MHPYGGYSGSCVTSLRLAISFSDTIDALWSDGEEEKIWKLTDELHVTGYKVDIEEDVGVTVQRIVRNAQFEQLHTRH